MNYPDRVEVGIFRPRQQTQLLPVASSLLPRPKDVDRDWDSQRDARSPVSLPKKNLILTS
jgi:hypothetical protein